MVNCYHCKPHICRASTTVIKGGQDLVNAQLLRLVTKKQIALQLTVPPVGCNESSSAAVLVPSSVG